MQVFRAALISFMTEAFEVITFRVFVILNDKAWRCEGFFFVYVTLDFGIFLVLHFHVE